MRPAALLLSVLALTLISTDATAQTKPSFAGTWSIVTDPNAPAPAGRGGRGMFGGLGQGGTIAQDEKTLTITRTTGAGEVKSVYNLDGSESKNTMAMRGNQVEQTSKATWEADKLVITTAMNMMGNDIQTTMKLSLDASGQLVIETTAPGRGGGAPTTTTTTYKKG